MPSSDYAVIDSAGMIVRTGECSLESLEQQAGPGEILIIRPGDVSDATHFWDFMVQDWRAYPPCPGPWAEFDPLARAWFDPRDHAAELAAAQQAALRQITAIRGKARLGYITDLPGQDMLYMAKAEEARAYLADAAPDPADYPLVMSEVGITASTAYEVAQIFANLNALWRYAAGSLDAACFQAEAAVQQAPDTDSIDAILAGLAAALNIPV